MNKSKQCVRCNFHLCIFCVSERDWMLVEYKMSNILEALKSVSTKLGKRKLSIVRICVLPQKHILSNHKQSFEYSKNVQCCLNRPYHKREIFLLSSHSSHVKTFSTFSQHLGSSVFPGCHRKFEQHRQHLGKQARSQGLR